MIHLGRRQAVRAELVQTQTREFYETAIQRLVSQWYKCLNILGNTSDIQVLVSVPRPPAHFFFNAPHILRGVGG